MKDYMDRIIRHYRNARTIWIVSGLFLLFSIIYTVTNIISINHKIKEINTQYTSESPMPGNELPGVFNMRKESAFWQSRLAMAKSDSICLTIDLAESMVYLELQGVTVHSAPIRHYRKSDLFESLKPEALLNLIGSPSNVVSHEGTVSKEPIKLKKAPKDTAEFNALVAKEAKDAAGKKGEELPVYYELQLNNGMQISFVEEEADGWLSFYLKQKIEILEKNSKQLTRFKLPEYTPGILIEMSREDATSIFRGIPEKASVALRL